jgi:hypothetical protein
MAGRGGDRLILGLEIAGFVRVLGPRCSLDSRKETREMADCHEMKLGETYVCGDCGLELKVVAECEECGAETCGCAAPCTFECCGEPLKLKEG